MVFRRYMRKVVLFHRSRFWMKESENCCRWSRLAAVTRIECGDHRFSSGSLAGRFRTAAAAFLRREETMESVMKRRAPDEWRKTAIGS